MAKSKFCSTGVMDAFFYGIISKGAGNIRIALMGSSADAPPIDAIASASSNSTGMLAQSTVGWTVAWPTSTDFSIGNSGNNRVLTVPACSCDVIRQTEVAGYVVILEDASSIRWVTTCTTQTVTAAGKVNIGSWTITINQPS